VARARDSNESKALSNITPRSTPDPIGETIWNYLEPSTSIRYPAVKDASPERHSSIDDPSCRRDKISPWAISSAG
jgi:hypothetical protein